MNAPFRRRLAWQVLWNLRGLGLFLIGPAAGVGLGAAIFGMPPALLLAAGLVFAVSLAMYATLVQAEWRRLAPGR